MHALNSHMHHELTPKGCSIGGGGRLGEGDCDQSNDPNPGIKVPMMSDSVYFCSEQRIPDPPSRKDRGTREQNWRDQGTGPANLRTNPLLAVFVPSSWVGGLTLSDNEGTKQNRSHCIRGLLQHLQ